MSEQQPVDPAPPKAVETPEEEGEDRVDLGGEHDEDADDAIGDDNEGDDYEGEGDDDDEEGDAGEDDDDDDEAHAVGKGQPNGDKQNLTALLLGDPKADDEIDEEEEEDDDDDEYAEDDDGAPAAVTKKRPIDEVTGEDDAEKDPKKVKA